MDAPVYCDNCGCFSTKANVWQMDNIVVCSHCFVDITNESPYQYRSVEECDEIDAEIDEFNQLMREIDCVRQIYL